MKFTVTAALLGPTIISSVFAAPSGEIQTKVTVDSSTTEFPSANAFDGIVTDTSLWMSGPTAGPHWLALEFDKPRQIAELHFFSGQRAVIGSVITSGEIQIKEGDDWKTVDAFSKNNRVETTITLKSPVATRFLRLYFPDTTRQIAIRELAVYDKPSPLGTGLRFDDAREHLVSVNQVAYNSGYPCRFTVPTAGKDDLRFTVLKNGGAAVFSGKIKDGAGDFTRFGTSASGDTYTIRVEGGSLPAGESFPFEVGPRQLQKHLLQPLVDFMIDSRSMVGTHASAYGGGTWRDGSYYTHELASLAFLFLACQDEIGKMPRQIDWDSEKKKVLDPAFKFVRSTGDEEMLVDTRNYYNTFEGPSPEAPDVVKLIHWGLGMTICREKLRDPSNDGLGLRVHSQSVEQVAYILALRPRLEKWIPEEIFLEAMAFVDKHWESVGLLEIPKSWAPTDYLPADTKGTSMPGGPRSRPFKGRDVPGHSILPNLLMYEVGTMAGAGNASTYLNAAISQADYVVNQLDWNDPRTTKGQRMSEHKMITGLVWLLQNYPDHAPKELQTRLDEWADIMISRSTNYWDFRRYDLGEHWTIPVMNEPGNLGGFPACALGVSWVIKDPAKKNRLREIAMASLDALFGRNPLNAASPYHPELGWGGKIEKGWPIGFKDGTTARLETVRGALASGPGSEHYPFSPGRDYRFPEGWTAFNAALNVGFSYLEFDGQQRAALPADCTAAGAR